MKNKGIAALMAFMMLFMFATPSVFATGGKEATASLFLPTTGQAMNGQLGNTKTKLMAGVEVASVTALAILGGVVGGPVIWVAAGPLIANHLWSATDAYRNAQAKTQYQPLAQQQMADAQRTLELSRERRFDRAQGERTDLRQRVMMAGEQDQ